MELGRGLGRGWEMRQSCGNHQARSPLSVSAGFWCPRGFFGAVFCPIPSSVTPGGAGPAAPALGGWERNLGPRGEKELLMDSLLPFRARGFCPEGANLGLTRLLGSARCLLCGVKCREY